MTRSRTARRLVRLYPPAFRARYGDELAAVIEQRATGGRVAASVIVDVVVAALRQRVHALRAGAGGAPPERARAGVLVVLWAFAPFVLAGAAVQRLSEHWSQTVPAGSRAFPAAAFDGLVLAAALGMLLVLGGVALALPALREAASTRGWMAFRRLAAVAAGALVAVALATALLVLWASRLEPAQRNGRDLAYSAGFVVWAFLVAVALVALVSVATGIARLLELSPRVLRAQARIAAGVGVAVGSATACTAIWWVALAAAPGGDPSPYVPAAIVAMLLATALAGAGARQALQAS